MDVGSTCRADNIMVARMILLLLLWEIRQVWWILEQPMISIMDQVDLWQCLACRPKRISTCTEALGAESRKPTWLLSLDQNKWSLPLSRSVPADAVFDDGNVVVRTADGCVAGGPGSKETQAHRAGYSLELLRLWKESAQLEADEICSSVSDTGYKEVDDCEGPCVTSAALTLGSRQLKLSVKTLPLPENV